MVIVFMLQVYNMKNRFERTEKKAAQAAF